MKRLVESPSSAHRDHQEYPRCCDCGYCLTGSIRSRRCPECGWTIDWLRVYNRRRFLVLSNPLLVLLLTAALLAIPLQVFPCSLGTFFPMDGGFAWDALVGTVGPVRSTYEPWTWNSITALQCCGAIATIVLMQALRTGSIRASKIGVPVSTIAMSCTLGGVISRQVLLSRPHPLDLALGVFCAVVYCIVRRKLLLKLPNRWGF